MRIFSALSCSLWIALPASATAQCILSGPATIDRVRVQPRGAAAFDLGLDEYDASVSPLGSGRVRVVSATALVWSGEAREGDVHAWTGRPVPLAGVTLGRGVAVSALRLPERGDPVADVELEDGVWIRGATIPCDALSLDETELDPTADDAPESGEVVARVPRVRVYERPGGRSVIIDVASGAELRFARTEARDGWIRVRRDYDAARIDGWVRTSDVRVVASAPMSLLRFGLDLHGGGGCGHGASHTYIGPATLLAGTELRTAQENGAVWAVASADMEVTIAFRWGAEWGQVEGIAGLRALDAQCERVFENAWVPESGVRLPSGQPPP